MRKSCYGTPVGDFKGWSTTAKYLVDEADIGSDAQITLKALVKVLDAAVFESKRPMVIRFIRSGLSQREWDLFRECFYEHIDDDSTDTIIFYGRVPGTTSPIVTWRKYYPNAVK
jgi:hypothetical protein